jgi:hypothetical protein
VLARAIEIVAGEFGHSGMRSSGVRLVCPDPSRFIVQMLLVRV